MDVPLINIVFWGILRFIVLVVLVIISTFILLHFSPVDPVKAYVGGDIMRMTATQYQHVAHSIGADLSTWVRFQSWLAALCHGDLGFSKLYNISVLQVLKERFLVSLPLLIGSWLLSMVIGLLLAMISGRYANTLISTLIGYFCYLCSCVSTYWISIILLFIFAIKLHWLPSSGAWSLGQMQDSATTIDKIQHLILPLIALSLIQIGNVSLHTRAKIEETLAKEFIHYAKARGEKGWSLLHHHVIRHALSPAICLQFSSLGGLLGSTLLVEKVFGYPGLGQATIDAGLMGDIPLFMGIILFSTLLVSLGNSAAQLINYALAPETR